MSAQPKPLWTLEFSAPSLGEAGTLLSEKGASLREMKTVRDAERPGFYRISSTDEGWLTGLRDELADAGHTTILRPEG